MKNIVKNNACIIMSQTEKSEILCNAKNYFKEYIANNHINNTAKLASLDAFNVNPFLVRYLAKFAYGNTSPESLAKVLILPRALGTSITTTFGTQMQKFCNVALKSMASTTNGIDIEFTDAIDGRHKWCQIKSGPDTINKDDVKTIKDHFLGVLHIGRTNGINISPNDCLVGVFYGTPDALSSSYKSIDKDYPVYVGQEFWYHLTGDVTFYKQLINSFGEVVDEMDADDILQQVIATLATDIENSGEF